MDKFIWICYERRILLDKNTNINYKKLQSVNFYKGIAIIMVILVHSAQLFKLPNIITYIPRFSQMGCQIFFVLSAFTLCMSYSKRKWKYKEFIKRRISKLAIGYWSMIIVQLVIRIAVAYIKGENLIKEAHICGMIINIMFLNGIIPNSTINNLIVRGGWFVGTIFVLYLLFPLMYKLYEKIVQRYKMCNYIFPLMFFMVSTTFLILLGTYNEKYLCINNGFIYFSFINQITCFSLGFSLYGLYINNQFSNVKMPLLKGIICLLISVWMFFLEYKFSFAFLPGIFGLCFFYFYIFTENKKVLNGKNTNIIEIIQKFGNISYEIYLTHPIIIYYIIYIVIIGFRKIGLPDTLSYIFLLPIMYISVYYLGNIFSKYIRYVKKFMDLNNNRRNRNEYI